MPETDIGSTTASDLATAETKFSVDGVETDAAQEQKETEYMNTNWSQQLGYYKEIPELRIVIDAKASWIVGKGFTSNEITTMLLMSIKGFGKDSFNTILENQYRVMNIGGDSFAEIIRDKDDVLINIKPLDPGVMKILVNRKGIIKGYKQISKTGTKSKVVNKFKPEEIFHLSRNRTADEIHGISLVDALVKIILMKNESMDDYQKLLHRNVFPVHQFVLDTDDQAKINEFKAKADAAMVGSENLYIPKGTVEHEIIAVPANSTLNPLPWINLLDQKFYQAAGVPQIIVGGSQEITEATAKILYVVFEQTIKEGQLYVEEQVLSQLNLELDLEVPASLMNDMLSGQQKSETMQAATPEDTSVTNVGVNDGQDKPVKET